jgi:hypothetical protein
VGVRLQLCALLALGVACNGAIEPAEARVDPTDDAAASPGNGAEPDTGTLADAGVDPGAGTLADVGADPEPEMIADAGANPEAGGGGNPPDTECAHGPLAAPRVDCSPQPEPSTGDWHADCIARINQLRWECQCLPPLARWVDGERCADDNAQYDSINGVHASFHDTPCGSGARAQNECPGWPSNNHIVNGCLQSMWDEGPEDGNPDTVNGHYESMATTTYSRVACGFHTTPSGEVWGVQNFD